MIEKGFTSSTDFSWNGSPFIPSSVDHQVGLQGQVGEWMNRPTSSDLWLNTSACRDETVPSPTSLVWYRVQLELSLSSDPNGVFAIDMNSMVKGQLYLNGHALGRYWLIEAPSTDCKPCHYAGVYDPANCRTGCGQPSQRYYHAPREWLRDGINDITFVEEYPIVNGPAEVQIVRMNKQ